MAISQVDHVMDATTCTLAQTRNNAGVMSTGYKVLLTMTRGAFEVKSQSDLLAIYYPAASAGPRTGTRCAMIAIMKHNS